MNSVELHNIIKTYGKEKTLAVNNVSFTVEKGELFGLIGPDGAGKTSIFRILTTLLLPDSGHAIVDGHDIIKDYKAIRNTVGYMPGRFSLYQDLSVEENLEFFATVFNTSIEKNYELIKDIYTQIEPFKTRKAGKLSGGMKQKLALCCALIHKPTVLFLDEPTTGVDAVSRKEFWDMLKRLKEQGITILVSTPYMDEATRCDRIALMQNGDILTIETPKKIIENYGEKLYAVKSEKMIQLSHLLKANKAIKSSFSFGEYHHITFDSSNEGNLEGLLNELKKQGIDDIQGKEILPGVEDCFIKLMGQQN